MKNVKGNKDVFLKKIQVEPGVGLLGEMVDERVGELMKFRSAFFEKNDSKDFVNVFVVERLSFLVFDSFVLPEKKICGIAGAALPGKRITNLLHLDIGNAAIFEFYYNIHNEQRRFGRDTG